MRVKICEIFESIIGETSLVGLPAIFIRFSGCNLRCEYCDTKYSWEGGRFIDNGKILSKIQKSRKKIVYITGGEPLLQEGLYDLLREIENKRVAIETNGSLDISKIPKNVKRIVDIKCPGSGMVRFNNYDNIKFLRRNDEVKFVIHDRNDYNFTKRIILKYELDRICDVLIGPVSERISPSIIGKWIIRDSLPVRLQIQLHKIIDIDPQRSILYLKRA